MNRKGPDIEVLASIESTMHHTGPSQTESILQILFILSPFGCGSQARWMQAKSYADRFPIFGKGSFHKRVEGLV